MSLAANFDYLSAEDKWYAYWMEQKFFESTPDERESYTIVIPPPNVTGVLHMGHMLNNTIQDVLIRRARMLGYNACWVPGTDHASIATEAKVVAKLKAEGIEKSDLSREEFLKEAWEWTEKHGGIIFKQLKKLGASCDWSREAFTLDDVRSESVIKTFVELHKQGLIYRGYRMVNWDPEAKTTISDEEVVHKQIQGKLYYLKYKIEESDGHLVVATTRPETIFGDVAICVNPEDERYKSLIGKSVRVPIANRSIPIIADDYVDLEFGTGCLKITPAHDINDKTIGDKHQLPILDVLDDSGKLNQHGMHYEGQDRFVVRKAIARELEEAGLMEKVEDYATSVGTSERTGAVIEPKLSQQWFLKMADLAEPALKAVVEGEVDLIPSKFMNTYKHWMENVHDWNISRQLWWGHQIPAWYYGNEETAYVVAMDEAEALELAKEQSGRPDLRLEDLRRDPDALDTWFSSWLWPLSVFDGVRNPGNAEVNYYYPTKALITAPEILFFWVARMIMAGYSIKGQKPFDVVYLTGIVRDKQGRKMSKSLGNSPDPIELMEKYSTDGVRVGMLLTSPAGNDLPFDEELCAQGRNFANKLWNALRLVKGWEIGEGQEALQAHSAKAATEWFQAQLASTLEQMESSFEQFRISEALMTLYKFVWDDFCSWYLEAVKPPYGGKIAADVYEKTLDYFEQISIMLHPFMPFITEEIWHALRERESGGSVGLATWPKVESKSPETIARFDLAREIIIGVRNIRAKQGISPKENLLIKAKSAEAIPGGFEALICKLANLDSLSASGDLDEVGFVFLAGKYEYLIPAADKINVEEELQKLQEELKYLQGFKTSVSKKLQNEKFVANAPEAVVEAERKKLADAESKIEALEGRLSQLGVN